MSLEAAQWIKDLVANNPEGTDPKSQGDDHLRMLKLVLKNQFPGFLGVGVTATEAQINGTYQPSSSQPGPVNLDAPELRTYMIAVKADTTGVKVPGAAAGDQVLSMCWGTSNLIQLWFASATNNVWMRRNNGGGWAGWIGITSIGAAQAYSNQTPFRPMGVDVVNTSQRALTVYASAVVTAGLLLQGWVNGANVALGTTTGPSGGLSSVSFIVPPGATYAVSVNSGGQPATFAWWELR